jgi:hypothetical protein
MHQPERWGYVQFSTARPGDAVFRPDPAAPIRDRLMQVYRAQKAFFKKNDRWARSLEELKLPDVLALPEQTCVLSPVADGYVAAVTNRQANGQAQTWTIREDSRIQSRPTSSPAQPSEQRKR